MRAVCALALSSLVLTACDFDVYSLPLPGGTDVGDDAITVNVEFVDVLDLVPQSSVKVNDLSVGQVTDIRLDGQTAAVTIEIRGDVALPENAMAEIRQTSLLGEKFVSLKPPPQSPSSEPLSDGDTIPLASTGRNPEVEEVLGALSLLLNGGGVGQLKTIASEINLALEGREDSAKSVLTQIALLTGQLDDNKGDIVDAIESLDRLARSAGAQLGSIEAALDELPSALVSIDRQRDDLVDMLQALNRLSGVGTRVIRESKDVTIEAFRQLQPVLTELANSGDAFVDSFNVILTYPFVDDVVGRDPQVARNLHMGDYTNLSVRLIEDLTKSNSPPGAPCTELGQVEGPADLENLCEDAQDALAPCLTDRSPQACLAALEDLTGAVQDTLCGAIPSLCLGGGGNGNGNGGGNGGGLPGTGNLPGGLGNLGGLLGVGRAGFGPSLPDNGGRGPTMGQLVQTYDPALVSLLTPGMVLR